MDRWSDGDVYDGYMGRWSRLVARELVDRLAIPAGATWLDVGCGTGALSGTILERAAPASVQGIDASKHYLETATTRLADPRFTAQVGDAMALPFADAAFDAVVSGLVFNFIPDPDRAAGELARVAKPNAIVALYLWDYAGEMQFLRRFWDAVVAVDPAARERDEGVRFPLCAPDRMHALLAGAGLREIATGELVVPTRFRDFEDLWQPFTRGQGPAPGYVATLDAAGQAKLRDTLRANVPVASDGSIELVARAWLVRAIK